MMLKVGDKLLCKKSSQYYYKRKGEYYTVTDINKNRIYFDHDWFSLYPNDYWYLWDYFYKPQEMRKMKLKQLNDESR